MVARWILLAVAVVIAGLYFLEKHRLKRDAEKFPCSGQRVDVNGRRMHVCASGEGERTLVLLPGLGTYADWIDFLPLTRRLPDFRCVVPEPFGYGWSDDTPEPRTVKNIVDEVRAGLRAAGFEPPYVLLGHSIAGLYVRWWACEYPDEVAGIIGDDPSLPEQANEPEAMKELPDHGVLLALLKLACALRPLGLGRLCTRLSPAYTVYMTGGDLAQLPAAQALAAAKWLNRDVLGEYVHFRENAAVADMRFPSCPMLMFVANGPASCESLEFKSGFSWVKAHQQTAERAGGKCYVLPDGHYLHWMFPDEMTRHIREEF